MHFLPTNVAVPLHVGGMPPVRNRDTAGRPIAPRNFISDLIQFQEDEFGLQRAVLEDRMDWPAYEEAVGNLVRYAPERLIPDECRYRALPAPRNRSQRLTWALAGDCAAVLLLVWALAVFLAVATKA